jgi:mono/diheme cytochrome c family protein
VLATRARAFAETLTWPGKAAPATPAARPLTAEEQRRFAAGAELFKGICAGCHQANGAGLAGVAKSLVRSRWVLGTPGQLVRIVQHGKEGDMLMPPVGASMTDDQLAAVLTYVRRSWGNDALPITPTQVDEVRRETAVRKKPWTEPELARVR